VVLHSSMYERSRLRVIKEGDELCYADGHVMDAFTGECICTRIQEEDETFSKEREVLRRVRC
jgi:hypothetical protein